MFKAYVSGGYIRETLTNEPVGLKSTKISRPLSRVAMYGPRICDFHFAVRNARRANRPLLRRLKDLVNNDLPSRLLFGRKKKCHHRFRQTVFLEGTRARAPV